MLPVGCARLGLSRKRTEFSVNLGRIDGKAHLCVVLAYTGRGRPGFYIPANLHTRPASGAVRGSRCCSATTERRARVLQQLGVMPEADE